jgi:hypothetical protein
VHNNRGDGIAMFAEQVEKMKRDYTDKYVLVDPTRPELARFRDVVGRVKTVNMNGRALVEFEDYHLNIGWYDIAPEYLKVVDQPPPKPPKTEAKRAPAAKAAPAEKKPAGAAPAKATGKPSVADILAAARGNKPPGGAPAAKPKAEAAAAKEKPAAAAPKVDRSKMSVADMIAAAKAGGAAGTAPAAPKAAAAPAEEAAEEAPAPAPAKKAAPAAATSSERIDKSKMSIDDMINWCREHDSK